MSRPTTPTALPFPRAKTTQTNLPVPYPQFPYALKALPDYLSTNWDSESFAAHRAAFPPEHATSPATLTAHVHDLTARDVKAPYLKALQGTLWDAGYRTHAYAAPVYGDVLAFLDRLQKSSSSSPAAATNNGEPKADSDSDDKQLKVAIYSSGSVAAQQLFFEHVADPDAKGQQQPTSATSSSSKEQEVEADNTQPQDRRAAVSAWFDTVNAGPKQVAASYTTIAAELGREPAEVLFLSDNVAEVRAAIEAGMKSIVVERKGNAPLSHADRAEFDVVTSFDQLPLAL